MKPRPVIIVIFVCLIGMATSAALYMWGQGHAAKTFAAELDIGALQRLVERQDTFLVYFYGRSCEDCAASEPYLLAAIGQLQAAGRWPPGLAIYKCERDANATVRSLYGVERTPTLLYYNTGDPSTRLEGPLMSVDEYSAFFSGLQ